MPGRTEPLARAMQDRSSLLVVSHVLPDGDSLGSSVALRLALEALGKRAVVLLPGHLPERYDFFRAYGPIHEFPAVGEGFLDGFEAVVVLDCSGWSRLGPLGAALGPRGGTVLCVDHHAYAEEFATLALVDDTCAATAMLVLELVRDGLGVTLSKPMAEALYVGVMTDTGTFSYANATPQVFRAAAELVTAGALPHDMHRRVNERYTLRTLEFVRDGISRIRTEGEGQIAWLALPHELFRDHGVALEDAAPIMRFVRGVRGARLAVVLYEDEPGQVKVSFRSRGDLDVAVLARRMGGGGHRAAAGVVLACPLEEAERRILSEALPLVAAPGGGATA